MSVQSDRLLEDWPVLGDDDDQTLHIYEYWGRERPCFGDVALCGHVKRSGVIFPSDAAADASGLPACERCIALDRLDPLPAR